MSPARYRRAIVAATLALATIASPAAAFDTVPDGGDGVTPDGAQTIDPGGNPWNTEVIDPGGNPWNNGPADDQAGMTRAELAAFASRTLSVLRGHSLPAATPKFADVDGHALAGDIAAAHLDRLVLGYKDGTFRPDAAATDLQVDVVLQRMRGVLESEGLVAPLPGEDDPMLEPIVATFDTAEGSFRVLIESPAAINRLAGAEIGTHVGIPNGRIVRGDNGINLGHDWHLVEVEIVDMTMELCDGTVAYIDSLGYDEFVAQHGDRFCPWGAIYLGSEPAVPTP